MKRIIYSLLVAGICCFWFSCKKEEAKTYMKEGTPPVVTLSQGTISLSATTAADTVATIAWTKPDFGFQSVVSNTVEIVKAGSGFNNPSTVNVGSSTQLKYLGSVLNDLAIGLGIPAGTSGDLSIRVRSALSDSISVYSQPVTLRLSTYQVAFPALLVRGGNSWVTPATRTNGFLLTSPDFNSKYEGYIYLPNADGWGGDAFKLESTSNGMTYGWGTSATTMSVGGGNLWLTPAPGYMKVNADVNALTISYTPVQFFISGDHNSWSTSATPMTYNPTTKQWVANNVSFTAGNKFVFTSNGNYDISYKVDANGKLVFAGPPAWAGDNITAPGTGTYTVILDLSGGAGNYTYRVQ